MASIHSFPHDKCGVMTAIAARLHKDRRGTTALEFAILFPVLLLFVLGALEMGMMLMTDAALQMGMRAASRYGIITENTNGAAISRTATITNIIQSYLAPWVPSGTTITITEKVYTSYANIGQPEPFTDLHGTGVYQLDDPYTDVNGNKHWDADQGLSSDGGSGDIVVYEASFSRPGFTGILKLIGITTLNYDRRMVVQNE